MIFLDVMDGRNHVHASRIPLRTKLSFQRLVAGLLTMRTVVCLAVLAAVTGPGTRAFAGDDAGLPGVTGRDKLYGVAVVGEHVWVVGFPGIVLHSADSGRTFQAQGPGGTTAWLAVDFADEKHGVVVGRGGKALVTSNGGKDWNAVPLPTGEPLFDVACPDTAHCYAVGNFAAAVRTLDGGKTWTSMHVVPKDEDPSLNSVAFQDPATGYVAGEFGLVMRTLDGGDTWQRVDDGMNQDNAFGVEVLPDGRVLVVGSFGLLQVGKPNPAWRPDVEEGASAGGDEEPPVLFDQVETGVKDHLFRVSATHDLVLLCGDAGTLLAAPDPKGPFSRLAVPTYQWLGDVAVGGQGRMFSVGGLGVLLTGDAGSSSLKAWGAR